MEKFGCCGNPSRQYINQCEPAFQAQQKTEGEKGSPSHLGIVKACGKIGPTEYKTKDMSLWRRFLKRSDCPYCGEEQRKGKGKKDGVIR